MAFITGDPNNVPNGYIIGGCHSVNSMPVVVRHLTNANLYQTSGSVTIGANNTNFGGDPCGGTPKSLVVVIRDSANSVTTYSAGENSTLTVTIPSNRTVANVIFASYGTPTVVSTPATKFDNTGWFISTTTRPDFPANGQVIYNSTEGRMEIYHNGIWKNTKDTRSGDYFYRTVITTSYVLGGYKDGTPWKNVNRMNHSTDIMTNLGDQMSVAANYVSGACNLTKAFVWNTLNTPGSSNVTVGFNMTTEVNAGLSDQWNTRRVRDDAGTIFNQHYFAYIIGGSSADVDVFNLTTETAYKENAGPLADFGEEVGKYNTTFSGASAFVYGIGTVSSETAGYAYQGDGDGNSTKLTFSTATIQSGGPGPYQKTLDVPGSFFLSQNTANVAGSTNRWALINGSNGQQKGINSKLGRGWTGNEGGYDGGYNYRRWNLNTETLLGTVGRPIGNIGEENYDMGQNWQYMMGMYNGAQNNRGHKFTYATESGYELGSGSTRTGVPGGSSGSCSWKG
jgi:hypothetical protein